MKSKKSLNASKKPHLISTKNNKTTTNSNRTKKDIKDKETLWFPTKKWEFRENENRKQNGKGSHPALVVGEKNKKFANLGLTHSPNRGHHKNIKLTKNPNPTDKKESFIRDDLKYDDKKYLRKVLKNYTELSEEDIDKICKIIKKKR